MFALNMNCVCYHTSGFSFFCYFPIFRFPRTLKNPPFFKIRFYQQGWKKPIELETPKFKTIHQQIKVFSKGFRFGRICVCFHSLGFATDFSNFRCPELPRIHNFEVSSRMLCDFLIQHIRKHPFVS